MRIHTNLTYSEIVASIPGGVYIVNLSEHRSRSRMRAFEIKLSGTSPYRTMSGEDYAATWDEWGVFLANVFDKDADAIAGEYKSAEIFHAVTGERFINGLPGDTHPRHKWEFSYMGGPHYCAKCSAMMDFHALRSRELVSS